MGFVVLLPSACEALYLELDYNSQKSLHMRRMNYVGQLAGSMLGRVRDLYNGMNPATLTGSIDVVVVRHPDGTFRGSPFHVRFGKLGVMRSAELEVDIEVNGEPVDLQMKLGENGEAFFLQELGGSEDTEVPPLCITSSLPLQCTPPLRIDSQEGSPNPLPSASPLPSATALPSHTPLPSASPFPSATALPSHPPLPSDTPLRRQRWSRKGSKKREGGEEEGEKDTLLSVCDSMYYSFSDLPEDLSPSQSKDFFSCSEELVLRPASGRSPSPKSDSELELRSPNTLPTEPQMEWDWGRLPQVTRSEIVEPQMSQVLPRAPRAGIPPQRAQPPHCFPPSTSFPVLQDPHKEIETPPQNQDKKDSPLGPPTLTPDDTLSPDSQEVSLYFPNSRPYPLPPPPQGGGSTEQASGSGPQDDLEPSEGPLGSTVALSLCGGLKDSWEIPEDRFLKHQISFSEFCKNPSLTEDPDLVLRIHRKFYNWAAAAPLILCMQVFHQQLPQRVIDQLTNQKMPPRAGAGGFPGAGGTSLPDCQGPILKNSGSRRGSAAPARWRREGSRVCRWRGEQRPPRPPARPPRPQHRPPNTGGPCA
ncbi:LOW QUALITY PROTEIN: phosphatidate phosphatase LPIN3-like [Ascaphus truei]|uniref:LOW QUALITY PROTEIN: phosphatidate phosphatase LPIN3-like n=1 Tax=Ascaphus truei TaxID=8439 RepID=UPI003F598FA7